MDFIKNEYRIFLTAVMFYTRIRVPARLEYKPEYLNKATRYFPVIGWITGTTAGAVFLAANYIFPLQVSVCLSMAATILLTGAFHEDGFADFCDGFGGGWTREKILEIMKDSRIGTYGAIVLILILLMKFFLIAGMPVEKIPFVLIFAHTLSRFVAGSFVYTHQYARADETSKIKPIAKGMSGASIIVAGILGLAPAFLPGNLLLLLSAIPLLIGRVFLGRFFTKWLGGYTGDCLGAVQQISEIIIYLSCFVIWKFI